MGKGRKNRVLKLTLAEIRYIIRAKTANMSSRTIALEMKVSIRTVNRVWGHWVKNKEHLPIKRFGRPKEELDEGSKRLILEVHKKQNIGARRLGNIIEQEHGVHIPHNAIHKVLLENGLASEDKRKKKRRNPWIRYERDHSLTLVHLDWHTSDASGKEVCAVLDDSSRMILAGGEFDAATAQSSIALVNEALQKYGDIRRIEEVITDRGPQFYANKLYGNGESESTFAAFLKENGIKHIIARINHPQTNGKIERWFYTYEKNRNRFENFDKLVNWCNTVRYHESLDTKRYLQTPEDAFWPRLPPECSLNLFLRRLEGNFNG